MLSKKQFNAAVARLRDMVTTPDIIKMLRHQLIKANNNEQHSEMVDKLDDLTCQFKNELTHQTPLDRRRAENYLANSLYGKNHSQVAHLMKGSKPACDEEFGGCAEMYGRVIRIFGSNLSFGEDELVDDHARDLAKRLRATSPEDFKVSYQGYSVDADRFDYCYQHNVLMYLSFLDLEIKLECILLEDGYSGENDVFDEYLLHISINGESLSDYGKKIGCQFLGDGDESSLLALQEMFCLPAFEMINPSDNSPANFYCSDFPESRLQKHQWELCLDRKYIAAHVIKKKLTYSIQRSMERSIMYKKNVSYSEDIIASVRGIWDMVFGTKFYDDIVLTVDGFKDSHIVSGGLNFLFSDSGTTVSIKFSYDDSYIKGDVFEFDIWLNGALIESCSASSRINDAKYVWREVISELKNVTPYIDALRLKD